MNWPVNWEITKSRNPYHKNYNQNPTPYCPIHESGKIEKCQPENKLGTRKKGAD